MIELTREIVFALGMGEETDALIASKVLGFKQVPGFHPEAPLVWHDGEKHIKLPNYSASIEAAFKVVNVFIARGKRPELKRVAEGDWLVQLDDFNENSRSWNPYLPLAICQSALLAILA